MAHDKIEQKTRAATERVAMGLDGFTRKMLNENQYMTEEVRCLHTTHCCIYCRDIVLLRITFDTKD
jgi:hypothetical protein